MDYFNDVLTMFLSLDCLRTLAVYGRDRELSEFFKNILICVPQMNEGLTCLERHEGELLMTFLGELSLYEVKNSLKLKHFVTNIKVECNLFKWILVLEA